MLYIKPATPPLLETSRFLLRPLHKDHTASIHRIVNDWGVVRMLRDIPFPYPLDMAEQWVTHSLKQMEQGDGFHFVITERHSAAPQDMVGYIGLQIRTCDRIAEIGYWIKRDRWQQKTASETVSRVCHWALSHLDIEAIEMTVAKENQPSRRLAQRIGFQEFGRGRQKFTPLNRALDVIHLRAGRDILNEETANMADSTMHKPTLLVVACALIDRRNRILLARRPEGKKMAGYWEFPGGKVEPQETPEAALVRELREELEVNTTQSALAPFAFASHSYDSFHLLMPLYICCSWQNPPQPKEGQQLSWATPETISEYRVLEADRPLIPLLKHFLT